MTDTDTLQKLAQLEANDARRALLAAGLAPDEADEVAALIGQKRTVEMRWSSGGMSDGMYAPGEWEPVEIDPYDEPVPFAEMMDAALDEEIAHGQ